MKKLTESFIRSAVVQGVGFIGIAASVIAFQCRTHRRAITFRTINELFFAVQYLLLGAYTGMAMNVIGCVRNTVFAYCVQRKKRTLPFQIIFSAVFLVFGIITWQGRISILIIAAKIMTTVVYGIDSTAKIRLVTLVTSSCWLFYNASVSSAAGVICEVITLASVICGIARIDIIPRLKRKR